MALSFGFFLYIIILIHCNTETYASENRGAFFFCILYIWFLDSFVKTNELLGCKCKCQVR